MKKLEIRLRDLQASRATKLESIDELIRLIEGDDDNEARNFTDEERTKFNTLKQEVDEVDRQIEETQELIEHKKAEAKRAAQLKIDREGARGEQAEKGEAVRQYSFLRAITRLAKGQPMDGIEAEMHQEAEKEARTLGISISGVGVPSYFIQDRALDAATAATAGNLIATNQGALIPALMPRTRLRELGAQFMTGLVGNLEMPRQTGLSDVLWEGETDAAASTDPTFDKVTLTPHRLAAYTVFSRQLMHQSSISVEQMVRQNLASGIARKVDQTGVVGNSSPDAPDGILDNAGITVVAVGTNGGAITHELLVALETAIRDEDADVDNMAFLTSPKVLGKLKTTKVDAGSGIFIVNPADRTILGYDLLTSTLMPDDLSKGSGTNLSVIVFGNWNQLAVGQWGGIDMTVDPYTLAKTGQIQVVTNSFWDFGVKQPKAFATIKDIDTSA